MHCAYQVLASRLCFCASQHHIVAPEGCRSSSSSHQDAVRVLAVMVLRTWYLEHNALT